MEFKVGDKIVWLTTDFKLKEGVVTRYNPGMIWVDRHHRLEDHINVRFCYPWALREELGRLALEYKQKEAQIRVLEDECAMLALSMRDLHAKGAAEG